MIVIYIALSYCLFKYVLYQNDNNEEIVEMKF